MKKILVICFTLISLTTGAFAEKEVQVCGAIGVSEFRDFLETSGIHCGNNLTNSTMIDMYKQGWEIKSTTYTGRLFVIIFDRTKK